MIRVTNVNKSKQELISSNDFCYLEDKIFVL